MARSLPRSVLCLALGAAVLATALGLGGEARAGPALLALGAAGAAVALPWRWAARRGALRLAAGLSGPRFLLRAAGWSAAAFPVLAVAFGLLGRALVAASWDDPQHSQAGLYVLLVGVLYGGAWAPAAGAWLAWRGSRPPREGGA